MARYVIDAPTLLHLVDAGLQVHPSHHLVAPNSIRSAALELLLGDVRAGKRTEASALEAHERMTAVKMRLLGDRVSRRTAWQLAREHDWSVLREAEYLAVAWLQADALVTVDPSLASAARDVVAVAAVDDLLAPGLCRCGLPVQGACGCGDGFGVGCGLEQCLGARFGHSPGVGSDEGYRPPLPRAVVVPCGCLDLGVDQLFPARTARCRA